MEAVILNTGECNPTFIMFLQTQIALSDTDRRELLEAFTHERAKRESEALNAHRELESKLQDMVSL